MSLHKYLINSSRRRWRTRPRTRCPTWPNGSPRARSAKEAAQLGTGLLIAGHETTANMIGIGPAGEPRTGCAASRFRRSQVHRQRRRRADALPVDHPERPAPGGHRGHRDRGETIRAGEGIIIDLAQRTGTARLSEPDKLDLSRDAGQQLGFGYGRHQCVGQQLARAELQIVFHTLLRRIPTLKLAIPFDEVPFKHDRLAYGVYELPVTW